MSASPPLLIAVDGPAASGKGTIARALASHFGLPHMDTGLLYRAVALALLRFGGDAASEFEAARAVHELDKIDPTDPELRSEIVGGLASRVSAYPAVRAALLDKQRAFAAQPGGAVLDGRDIGTVIAPGARVKLFVTASPEVLADIRARDERDSSRAAAPLEQAADAELLDTSALDAAAAIARAIAIVEGKLGDAR